MKEKIEFVIIGNYSIKIANIRYILLKERKHKITVCLMNNRFLFIKLKDCYEYFNCVEKLNEILNIKDYHCLGLGFNI